MNFAKGSEDRRGARIGFIKKGLGTKTRRVVIHYHPNKTYSPKLLKKLLSDCGWDESDLKRLKLIKLKGRSTHSQ